MKNPLWCNLIRDVLKKTHVAYFPDSSLFLWKFRPKFVTHYCLAQVDWNIDHILEASRIILGAMQITWDHAIIPRKKPMSENATRSCVDMSILEAGYRICIRVIGTKLDKTFICKINLKLISFIWDIGINKNKQLLPPYACQGL